MAQGDIIDVMFGWFIDIIGWFFKMIIKLIIGTIKFIWNLIFSKKEEKPISSDDSGSNNSQDERTQSSSNDVLSYEVILNNITKTNKLLESNSNLDDENSLVRFIESFQSVLLDIIFSGDISIREKFLLLEQFEAQVGIYCPPHLNTVLYPGVINKAYDYLYENFQQSMMIGEPKELFKKSIEEKSIDDYTADFKNLFAFALLYANPQQEITISDSDFEDLKLPKVIFE